MGLALPVVQLLASLAPTYRWGGRVLTIGVQFVQATRGEVERAASCAGVSPHAGHRGCTGADPSPADDRFTLGRLGFSEVVRLDLFPEESPDVVADMTAPLSDALLDAFDAVIDGGSLEHVFDVPAAARNMSRCLRVGGLVVHISPMSGWGNHGFYQMSPKLWGRLWAGSGFAEIQAWTVDLPRARGRPYVRHVTDLDAPLECDTPGTRTLLVFIARKSRDAPVATPIDSHLAEFRVPRTVCLAPQPKTIEALRSMGLIQDARGGICARSWRRVRSAFG